MVPLTLAAFRPHRLLRGAHRQTLAGHLMRPSDGPPLRRETWDTPDADLLDVDFCADPSLPDGAPMVLVLHGLGGSSGSGYVGVLLRELAARGLRGVALNYRSCGGRIPLQPRSYHAGETEDPRFVLDRLFDRGAVAGAVGFSLGGNILLKLLGEGEARLPAAVSVSAPHDLARSVRRLDQGLSVAYQRHLLRALKQNLHDRPELDGLVDRAAGLASPSLRDFDDRVTAPLHGFGDAATYYARCSSMRFVPEITTPTLVIRALDDPFIDPADVACLEGNPKVSSLLPEHGGHVGFAERRGAGVRWWAEATAAGFLARPR